MVTRDYNYSRPLDVHRWSCYPETNTFVNSIYEQHFLTDKANKTIPRNYLIPFILFFTLMGSYIGQNNETELLLLIFLGFSATILKFANYPLAPLLIGFILGSMLENNFARAMNIYDGFGFIWERPLTAVLLFLSILLIFLPALRSRLAYRKQETTK